MLFRAEVFRGLVVGVVARQCRAATAAFEEISAFHKIETPACKREHIYTPYYYGAFQFVIYGFQSSGGEHMLPKERNHGIVGLVYFGEQVACAYGRNVLLQVGDYYTAVFPGIYFVFVQQEAHEPEFLHHGVAAAEPSYFVRNSFRVYIVLVFFLPREIVACQKVHLVSVLGEGAHEVACQPCRMVWRKARNKQNVQAFHCLSE